MTVELASPSDFANVPKRDAGGDNEVPRDDSTRPLIIIDCWKCDGVGTVSSEKTGKPVHCPSCRPHAREHGLPPGKRLKAYTRTTTYIDPIEDKKNIDAWKQRNVLVGVALDRTLLDGVPELADIVRNSADKDEIKKAKDELNRLAHVAQIKAGSEEKADKGTHLHGLSEMVDLGEELPQGISFNDVIDMDAYKRATRGLKIVHMEKLVVHDDLQIGGTPDRVSEWQGELHEVQVIGTEYDAESNVFVASVGAPKVSPLIAPDGHKFLPGELIITDLKTGTMDYGRLKMAMQLAVYAHSELYDHKNGSRTPLGNINRKWGIIMSVPAGTGTATLYWVDLELGWRAVHVARDIREMRRMERKAFYPLRHEGPTAIAA